MGRRFYTTQPEVFELGNGLAFLLNMAFYGLVRSEYQWFGYLKKILEDFGIS